MLLQALKRSLTIAARLFGTLESEVRVRTGCGIGLHLELLAGRLGFLQLPSEEHYLLPVARQSLHVRLQVLRQRLSGSRHTRQLPADVAAAADDKGHDLEDGTQRIR